jgi:hypothetical protein
MGNTKAAQIIHNSETGRDHGARKKRVKRQRERTLEILEPVTKSTTPNCEKTPAETLLEQKWKERGSHFEFLCHLLPGGAEEVESYNVTNSMLEEKQREVTEFVIIQLSLFVDYERSPCIRSNIVKRKWLL